MAETAEKIKDDEPVEDLSARRIDDARRWLREFYRNEGLDKTALARRLGLGKEGRTVVARFLVDGRLDDETNFARIGLAVERLRALEDGPEGVAKFMGFVETRCVKIVNNHLARVRDHHLLGAVVGPYGAGKSYALRKAQELSRHDGKAPIRIVRCRVTTGSLPALVSKLAINMGLIEREGPKISGLHEDIVRRLAAYPEFLVFDEADHLTHDKRCLEFIRDLHDETGTGVLLAGQMYFLSWVWQKADFRSTRGDEAIDRMAVSGPMAPFADRLSVEIAPGLDDAEVVDIAEETLNGTLTEEASKRLTGFIQHDFRALCEVLRVMRDMRIKAGKSIDHLLVERAWARSKHIKARQ